MPGFTTSDARRHTKQARGSPRASRAFTHAAESVYRRTGSEKRAIMAGNAAARQSRNKSRRSRRT